MTAIEFVSRSLAETADIGRAIAAELRPGLLIGMTGTLGSGKTALTRAIAAGLEIDPDTVVSPTFALCVPYRGRLDVQHIDAYRIGSLDELDELGLDEQLEAGAVLIVEWFERIQDGLPCVDLDIEMTPVDEHSRQIRIRGATEAGYSVVSAINPIRDQ